MMIYLGLSFSFHILVGFYAALCSLFAIFLSEKNNKLASCRINFYRLMRLSPLYLLTGCFGVYTVVHYLQENQFLELAEKKAASLIYVTFRLPHHLYPPFFPQEHILQIIPYALTFILGWIFIRHSLMRKVNFYALGTIFCLFLGMAIWFFQSDVSWLKFYWFRYFSGIANTLSILIAGYWLNLFYFRLKRKYQKNAYFSKLNQSGALRIAVVILGVMIFFQALVPDIKYFIAETSKVLTRLNKTGQILPNDEPIIKAYRWVREKTPKDSLFFIRPHSFQGFYYHSERARLVSV